VLVLGGTGGVGSLAVQIAKALGATVAATGSNTDMLTSLGADVAINYHEKDWGVELAGQDYDLIFATVDDSKPAPAAERALKVLGTSGSFICLLESILPKEGLDLGGRKFEFMLTDSMDYVGRTLFFK
jgi:NADPH:quinone reductase-like Zn-dependent oxidoreductase